MAAEETSWQKWVRNGRLATIGWGLIFIAWITFKVMKIPLEGLDTVFVIMSGAWVTNLGISTVKPSAVRRDQHDKDQRDADKVGDTNA